ncbi:8-amino-7-oxononanoate synthase [compost metagenome]
MAALQARGASFLAQARAAGVDTGTSTGLAIVPAIVGTSLRAAKLSSALFGQGINAQPILYPAVPEKSARLRFFLCSEHSEADIALAVATLARELARL